MECHQNLLPALVLLTVQVFIFMSVLHVHEPSETPASGVVNGLLEPRIHSILMLLEWQWTKAVAAVHGPHFLHSVSCSTDELSGQLDIVRERNLFVKIHLQPHVHFLGPKATAHALGNVKLHTSEKRPSVFCLMSVAPKAFITMTWTLAGSAAEPLIRTTTGPLLRQNSHL